MIRNAIVHYHLFKNAGSSVDEVLKANFPNRWVTREFSDGQQSVNIAQVGQWIEQEKDAVAFSSHTAMLPPPRLDDVQIFPIIFVRHPIDRIASVYAFERNQVSDSFGAVLARNTTLAGYIEARLSRDRQCRNFHVAKLAQMFSGEEGDETTLAFRALDNLPFVGLVEKFDQSIARLAEWLSPYFPGFHAIPVARNVSRDRSIPLEQRLENIRAEIGEEYYERLLEANRDDLALYDAVRKRLSMDRRHLVRSLYQGVLHRDPEPDDLERWASKFDQGLSVNEMLDELMESEEHARVQKIVRGLFAEPGHFYSPIVNVDEIREMFSGAPMVTSLPAIRISKESHTKVWNELLPFLRDIPFPEVKSPSFRYYFTNTAFSYGDGSILHAMLRRYRPKRLIEIGSGYSSACAVDTIDRYLDGKVEVSFIEPYPELLLRLLGEDAARRFKIHDTPVQKVSLSIFESLEEGDFLFIDSTHVMKTGSDVCHELFNILPALKPGVFVHFHDIPWPFEYGRKWVLEQNRSWNEIYGLRAFLMYNDAFEIVFMNDYFVNTCRHMIQADYPAMLKNSGASIWLRKMGEV